MEKEIIDSILSIIDRLNNGEEIPKLIVNKLEKKDNLSFCEEKLCLYLCFNKDDDRLSSDLTHFHVSIYKNEKLIHTWFNKLFGGKKSKIYSYKCQIDISNRKLSKRIDLNGQVAEKFYNKLSDSSSYREQKNNENILKLLKKEDVNFVNNDISNHNF